MPNQTVLVLNCGSSSVKFAIIDTQSSETYLTGLAENIESDSAVISWKIAGAKHSVDLPKQASHQDALVQLVSIIQQNGLQQNLVAVGHRVVHGGEQFVSSAVIDSSVIATIKAMAKLAPLHNPANLQGIEAALSAFNTLPQVAVFDTAFHQTMPKQAYLYALPYSLYQQHGIRRYGFHGTSHYYVANQAAEMLDKPIEQCHLITAHLGNGCSITAIKNGQSVDTSMGLTPLEGLVMGTRSGDVDPGLFNYLTSQLNMTSSEVDKLLNKQSGLLGISEQSNDCRTLTEAMEAGDKQAELALDIFSYRIAKYIASYTVPLGKLDAIVFTGGIGENSAPIRAKVLAHLAFFNIELDTQANNDARFGNAGLISGNSAIKALVIPTNEEWVIAHDTFQLTQVN